MNPTRCCGERDALLEKVAALRNLAAVACGDLAERVAEDMDHKNRDHSRWYKAVKKVRAALSPADSREPS